MADGLEGTFKDFGENKSFDSFEDFAKHLSARGEIQVSGSVKCLKCSTVDGDFSGLANIDSVTGSANVICADCEAKIASRVAARGRGE